MDFGFTAYPAIAVICFLLSQGIKATPLNNKWLPVICGTVGAALGVVGMLTVPAFPAMDPLSALAVGIVSGLAATGAHQAVKQLTSTGKEKDHG